MTTAFASPLSARVSDGAGNPVAGASVTFTLPASGPSATFPGGALTAVAATDVSGIATSPILTANGVQGSFTATAAAAGVTGAVQYALTNVAGGTAAPVPALGPLGLILLAAAVGIAALRSRRGRGGTMQ